MGSVLLNNLKVANQQFFNKVFSTIHCMQFWVKGLIMYSLILYQGEVVPGDIENAGGVRIL